MIIDWCCMWKSNKEFVDHLILHFSFASDLAFCIYSLSDFLGHAKDSNLVAGMLARKVQWS